VLLIVSDDLTACLGSYGNPVCRTPHLDRLAREGVRFDRAYCQNPVCGPSRSSFMSGLYPHTIKMLVNRMALGAYKTSNPLLTDHPSIAGLLRANGYFAARISKIFHMGVPGSIERGDAGGDDPDSWDWTSNLIAPETFSAGRLELLSPKNIHYGSNFTRLIVQNEHEATQADVMAATQAVAFLENRAGSRPHDENYNSRPKPGAPFFLAVGFVRPHVPLVAPARIFRRYPENGLELPSVPADDFDDVPAPVAAGRNENLQGMNEEQQRKALGAYYASVTFMDEQVGRLLAALDRLDLRRNTIVIFTSDHGYNLGEHDSWSKGHLWEESARVPLLISAPGYERTAGRVAAGTVELIDLYPTIADLVGLRELAPGNLQGMSLRPLLEQPERKDWSKSCAYTVTQRRGRVVGESIRTVRWRYNTWSEAGEELYDHENDPHEFTNLARGPAHAETLNEMKALWRTVHERALRDAD
jgi:arylsulfatase A-like enzyme